MREEDSSCWYFAFGSNMDSKTFINARKMAPISEEVARLSGFELVFDQKGIPVVEPAFASIKESKDSEVWGVLYKLSKENFERLHYTEGNDYEVRSIEVQGNVNGLIQCSTYIGRESKPGLTPSRRYLRKLINGAVQHELPDDYINKLKLYKSTYIPVASEIAGLLIKIFLWYSSKGKTVNLIVAKSGASYSAPEKENV